MRLNRLRLAGRFGLFIILSWLTGIAGAQTGSTILSTYTNNCYWNELLFPAPANGNLYTNPSADTSVSSWSSRVLSVFKFSPGDYDGHCMDSIRLKSTFVPDTQLNNSYNYYYNLNPASAYQQSNPVRKYAFSLHGITDTAYITYTPKAGPLAASDTEICFFIIPGSGDNQTTAIMRNVDYHVTNCNVVGTLRQHGDVYIFIKPNEDARTIRVQQLPTKKIATDQYPTDSYLNTFLIANSRHEGINYLIECLAAIKEMKRKYKKVFLLGCSQGGFAGLYAALEGEPDGVLISSGYSIKIDDNISQFGNIPLKFAQLPSLLTKDSIKQRISKQKSVYYFSWPWNDELIYQNENQYHYTENYFNTGNPLTNTRYLYTYANHAFPPCQYIDSFVKQVKYKPKAFLGDTLNTNFCDSLVRQVSFTGQAPFSCAVYHNGQYLSTLNNLGTSSQITVYQEGSYQLKDITDAYGNSGIWSDLFRYNKYPMPKVDVVSTTFSCDSTPTHINLKLSGTAPFQLSVYKKDGAGSFQFLATTTVQDTSTQLLLDNGIYRFTMQDAKACEVAEDTFLVHDTALQYTFIGQQYDCNQHKTRFAFALQGRLPYTVSYYKNGTLYNSVVSSDTAEWLLDNGVYLIDEIQDANNCHVTINQLVSLNYNALDVSSSSPQYQCNLHESAIDFQLAGNAPYTFQYTKDNLPFVLTLYSDTTMYYPNGDWQFLSITDQAGCQYTFTTPLYHFDYDTLSVSSSAPQYQCNLNASAIDFHLEGNAPFTFQYTKNNLAYAMTLNGDTTIYFPNGDWQFIDITDQTGCQYTFTTPLYHFDYHTIAVTSSAPQYQCNLNESAIAFQLQGNAPYTFQYTKDNLAYALTLNGDTTIYFPNGDWQFLHITDQTGCQYVFTTPLYHFDYDTLAVSTSAPQYQCNLNESAIDFHLEGNAPYTFHYTKDNLPYAMTLNGDTTIYFPKGDWQFLDITDQTGCQYAFNTPLYHFDYHAIAVTSSAPQYQCSLNESAIAFQLEGNAPYTFQYTKDNLAYALTLHGDTTIYFSNGNWQFFNMTDQTGCLYTFTTPLYHFDYDTLSVSSSAPQYQCNLNESAIAFQLAGNAPFTFQYTKNNLPYAMTLNGDTTIYFQNGDWQFIDITDQTGCQHTFNTLLYHFDYSTLTVSSSTPQYLCNVNQSAIDFQLGGNAPYTFQYTKNNLTYALTLNGDTTIYFPNGDWQFLHITDQTGCQYTFNTPLYHFNFDTLAVSTTTPQYQCNLNESAIAFQLAGNAPYTLSYTKNGVSYAWTLNGDTTMYFPDGDWQFVNLTDQTGCQFTFNTPLYHFDYDSLAISTSSPQYHCERNESAIDFHLGGNAPYIFQYTKDNLSYALILQADTTIYYPNGDWQFISMTDQTGCQYTFNTPLYHFNYDTFQVTVTPPVYDCDSNQTRFQFGLHGNPPFNIDYLANGNTQLFGTSNSNASLYLPNGTYLLQSITDSMGCHLDTNAAYTFNAYPLSATISQQNYDCDSNKYHVVFSLGGNAPWQIFYHNLVGNFTDTSSNPSYSVWLSNQQWMIDSVTDATGCRVILALPLTLNYSPIQAMLTSQQYDCAANLYDVGFNLGGNAPWIVSYVKTGPVPQYINDTTFNPQPHYMLPNGTWVFYHVSDQTGCEVNLTDTVVNSYDSLSYQKTGEVYDCDSNKLKLSYSFTGNTPWKFVYKNNVSGQMDTLQSNQPSLTFYLPNGQYTMLEVMDSICSKPVNDTVHVQFTPLQSILTTPTVDCDSGRYAMQLISQGGLKPYQYIYTYNSITDTLISYQDTTMLYMPNGHYLIQQVIDSLHCTVQFNQVFDPEYHPFHFDSLQTTYLCEKDSTRIDLVLSNQHPVYLAYSKNGAPTDTLLIDQLHQFIVGNGHYQWINLSDSLGCYQYIQTTTDINYHRIHIDTLYLEKDCGNKEYLYHLQLQGQAPWTLRYNALSIPDTLLLPTAIVQWSVTRGEYYLAELRDATNCVLAIGRSDTLPPFMPGIATLQWINNELVVHPEGYMYRWYYNNQLIDSSSSNQLPTRGPGQYQAGIVDLAGCTHLSNYVYNDASSAVEAYPNPVRTSVRVLINQPFGRYWNYTLTDIAGQKIMAGTSTKPFLELDLGYLQSGAYNLLVVFQQDNEKHLLRLTKD